MSFITYLTSLLFFANLSIAGYVLKDDYSPSVFFDMFDFFTSSDPTNGFVDYVDQSTASANGYISTTASTIHIGTDHTNVTPNGRPSVRLTSKNSYNSGSLVILDLAHMPGGICGTWPAFWMVGPDWPNSGEIDIIEGVNVQTGNAMTLHTSDGCAITDNGNFTGSMSTDDCYIYAEDQTSNAGCSIDTSSTQSYGTGFNAIGGGVYAMEWTDAAISIWFFPRTSIPHDITAGTPTPSGWGMPMSQFQGCCEIPEYFVDNQIVFDLTFCGDWAGNVWSSSTCSSLGSTCNSYVEQNPSAFKNAYWTINSLRVYDQSSSSVAVNAAVKIATPATSTSSASSSSTSAFSASSSSTSASSASTSSTSISSTLMSTTSTSSEASATASGASNTVNTVSQVQALANTWSTAEPDSWRADIDEVERGSEATASEKAEDESKRKENNKRWLARHRRRSGHH